MLEHAYCLFTLSRASENRVSISLRSRRFLSKQARETNGIFAKSAPFRASGLHKPPALSEGKTTATARSVLLSLRKIRESLQSDPYGSIFKAIRRIFQQRSWFGRRVGSGGGGGGGCKGGSRSQRNF